MFPYCGSLSRFSIHINTEQQPVSFKYRVAAWQVFASSFSSLKKILPFKYILLIFKICITYLKSSSSERGRETYLLLHFRKYLKQPGLDQSIDRILVLHWGLSRGYHGARKRNNFLLSSQEHHDGAGSELEQPGIKLSLYGMEALQCHSAGPTDLYRKPEYVYLAAALLVCFSKMRSEERQGLLLSVMAMAPWQLPYFKVLCFLPRSVDTNGVSHRLKQCVCLNIWSVNQ